MQILTRYLTIMYLTRFGFLLMGIAGFILSLDLVTNAETIAARTGGDMMAVATYAALKSPQIVSETIKYSCLLAALLTLISLMRHNQLAPIWDGGISQFGVIWRLVPAALAIGILQFVIDDGIVPNTNAVLLQWDVVDQEKMQSKNARAPTSANWITVDNDIVRIPNGLLRTRSIRDFIIFQRNGEGRLEARLDVTSAKSEDVGWDLDGVLRRNIDGSRETLDRLSGWGAGFKPRNIEELTQHPRNLAFHRLLAFVWSDTHGTWAPHLYGTWLQVKIAVCFVPLLMVFLVIALSQQFHRTARTEFLFVVGLALGFVFFIANGVGLAMGEVGLLPPIVAAWAPTVVFAAITGAMAFSREVMTSSTRFREPGVP